MLELIERPWPWCFLSLIITTSVNVEVLNILISRRRKGAARLGSVLRGNEATASSGRRRWWDLLLSVRNIVQRTSRGTRVSDFNNVGVEGDVRSANTVVAAGDGCGGERGGQFAWGRLITVVRG